MCGGELPSLYDLHGEHGAQVVLLHCRLVFTRKIEDAIVNDSLVELTAAFDAYILKASLLAARSHRPVDRSIARRALHSARPSCNTRILHSTAHTWSAQLVVDC